MVVQNGMVQFGAVCLSHTTRVMTANFAWGPHPPSCFSVVIPAALS